MIAIGRRVYGLGALLLGVVEVRFGGISPDWLPAPTDVSADRLLAWSWGGLLIAAGLAINIPRITALAALALAALFAGSMLVLELPPALAKPAVWAGWQGIAESTAMAMGAVVIFAQFGGVSDERAATIGRVGRRLFGVCLVIFGISHFAYATFTASLVPAWLPPSQIVWTWVTGLAQIAAGLAMLSGVQTRLAAIMLTIMYASFGLLVHIPSVLADPSSHDNWAENGINLILVGAAWSLADWLSKTRLRR